MFWRAHLKPWHVPEHMDSDVDTYHATHCLLLLTPVVAHVLGRRS